GLNLPDVEECFYEYKPDTDAVYDYTPDKNDWGTRDLINAIEGTARGWVDLQPKTTACNQKSSPYGPHFRATRLGVGDLSKFGGQLWFHSYDSTTRAAHHQTGLGVDIRCLRKHPTGTRVTHSDTV